MQEKGRKDNLVPALWSSHPGASIRTRLVIGVATKVACPEAKLPVPRRQDAPRVWGWIFFSRRGAFQGCGTRTSAIFVAIEVLVLVASYWQITCSTLYSRLDGGWRDLVGRHFIYQLGRPALEERRRMGSTSICVLLLRMIFIFFLLRLGSVRVRRGGASLTSLGRFLLEVRSQDETRHHRGASSFPPQNAPIGD
jgi:hypothetical protein